MFTLKLHHGGKFTKFPSRRYANGKVNFVDYVDIDLFSAHDLDEMMEWLGYDGVAKIYYHFMIPDSDLDFGLKALGNDADVMH